MVKQVSAPHPSVGSQALCRDSKSGQTVSLQTAHEKGWYVLESSGEKIYSADRKFLEQSL